MAKFSVGEIAILMPAPDSDPGFEIGERVEIIATNLNRPYRSKTGQIHFCQYKIRTVSGRVSGALESELRKLPPDDTQDHVPESMRNIFKLPQANPDAPVVTPKKTKA